MGTEAACDGRGLLSGRARGGVSGVRWSGWLRLATCLAASAQAAETAEHDTSTEGEGWRSPTLWVSIVVIISAGMGMAISKVYRERVIPMCLKFPIGQQVHSFVPVVFALVLMMFYFEAGLYLIMDGESGAWHVLVGFATLVGGSYYSWHVYAWSLPDEVRLLELLNRQAQQSSARDGGRISSYEKESMNGGSRSADEL
jgi:hypothetical protein